MINDFKLSEHFNMMEFQCRCCGRAMICPRLVALLEELRARRGRPLILTSGYRCERHNSEVGGSRSSLHMRGRAADISVPPAEQRVLALVAREIGFTEVIEGGDKNYLHVAIK